MRIVNRYSDRIWINIIAALSLVVFAIVILLLFHARSITAASPEIYILPKLNAFINGSVAVLLTAGYIFIRNKNMKAHRACMVAAFTLSILFLVSYIIYHANVPDTHFGDLNHDKILSPEEKLQAGNLRYVYYFLLLTHILLAAAIIPLTLLTLYRILNNQVAKHRKIARITFPLWLYVSVTGVIVYLLISPYYPF